MDELIGADEAFTARQMADRELQRVFLRAVKRGGMAEAEALGLVDALTEAVIKSLAAYMEPPDGDGGKAA